MSEWPFGDAEGSEPPRSAGARAEDLFLLWLMRLPLDADVALGARRLLATAPEPARDTALQRRLRELLTEAAHTAEAA